MNELIDQLAEQATTRTSYQYQTWGDRTATHIKEDFDKEKFAQLIVLDLLKKIENEASTYAEPVWALELVNDIKDAYGIE